DAKVPNFAKNIDGILILNENIFRDFEFEARGRPASLLEDLRNSFGEIARLQLRRRKVDGHRKVKAALLPGPGLTACCLHHPKRERVRDRRVFCHMHEVTRANKATVGVPPADKRFRADYTVVLQTDFWLVIDVEFLSLEGAGEFSFESCSHLEL